MFIKTWKDFVFCVGDTSPSPPLPFSFLLLYLCLCMVGIVCMSAYTVEAHIICEHECTCMHAYVSLGPGESVSITLCLIHFISFSLNPGLIYSAGLESLL